jgi:hypothetical protein
MPQLIAFPLLDLSCALAAASAWELPGNPHGRPAISDRDALSIRSREHPPSHHAVIHGGGGACRGMLTALAAATVRIPLPGGWQPSHRRVGRTDIVGDPGAYGGEAGRRAIATDANAAPLSGALPVPQQAGGRMPGGSWP